MLLSTTLYCVGVVYTQLLVKHMCFRNNHATGKQQCLDCKRLHQLLVHSTKPVYSNRLGHGMITVLLSYGGQGLCYVCVCECQKDPLSLDIQVVTDSYVCTTHHVVC